METKQPVHLPSCFSCLCSYQPRLLEQRSASESEEDSADSPEPCLQQQSKLPPYKPLMPSVPPPPATFQRGRGRGRPPRGNGGRVARGQQRLHVPVSLKKHLHSNPPNLVSTSPLNSENGAESKKKHLHIGIQSTFSHVASDRFMCLFPIRFFPFRLKIDNQYFNLNFPFFLL